MDETENPKTLDTLDAVFKAFGGMEQVGRVVGVVPTAVGNASKRKFFPASWFHALDVESTRRGFAIDRALFGFRPIKIQASDDERLVS